MSPTFRILLVCALAAAAVALVVGTSGCARHKPLAFCCEQGVNPPPTPEVQQDAQVRPLQAGNAQQHKETETAGTCLAAGREPLIDADTGQFVLCFK